MRKISVVLFFCATCLIVLADCAQLPKQVVSKSGTNSATAEAWQPVRVSASDADAAEPATAVGHDGSVYVAWVEHHADKSGDVMLARFDVEGRRQEGAAVRVNTEAGVATAWRGDPPTIAVAPDATIYVGWTGRVESPTGHATNIYLSASHDNGRTFAAPVRVNDDSQPAVHGMHSLAIADDGRIFLAWLDERNVNEPQSSEQAGGHHMESNREVFATFSTDGGRTFAANQLVAKDACPCCKTALAAAHDGRLYVSWRQVLPDDFRHIAVASTTDGGRTFSAPVIVSDDHWQIAGCPVSGSALAVDLDGALRVLWYSEGSAGATGLYWSESRDEGHTFSPRQLLASGQAFGTPVALNAKDNLAVVCGMSEGASSHLMTAQLDRAGHIATKTNPPDSNLPSAAMSADGRLFIAYLSKTGDHRSVWLARVDG
jgi:hypothetical protein